MEKVMNRIWLLAMMAMLSPLVGFAQDDPEAPEPEVRSVSLIVDELTGGTVTKTGQVVSESDANMVVVTLTVTPDEDYKITKDDITVYAVYPIPSTPASGTRSPEISGILTLVGSDPKSLSASREYQVTIDPSLDIWIEKADFQLLVPANDISGDENSSVTWTLSEGVLSIDGTGKTKDFDGLVPWNVSDITSVVVGAGVTGLGANIFQSCTNLTSIKINHGEKVLTLGENAIPQNEGLTIDVPANLLNEYLITWSDYVIDSENKVEIGGFTFAANHQYDTFVALQDIVVPSVLAAYTITGIDGSALVLTRVSEVAAGEPVLVFTEHQEIPAFYTAATDGVVAGSNLLKVAPEGGKTVTIGQVYMLYNDNFYFTQAGTIPEGQVYLEPQSQNGTRSFYSLDGDGTTAIDSQRIVSVGGQSAWYSLDGRRLSTIPTRKGIYINNGKKVVIK